MFGVLIGFVAILMVVTIYVIGLLMQAQDYPAASILFLALAVLVKVFVDAIRDLVRHPNT